MSEEQAKEITEKIDWKKFSYLLMYKGVVDAAAYAVSFTENEIDDTAVNIVDKVGEFLLKEYEEEKEA